MKAVLVVPDGMADWSVPGLGGDTPLMRARTPMLEELTPNALVGKVLTVPEGFYPGSDVANMALLGYDPRSHYTGRGPIEASAMGVPLEPTDVAFRCSLISTDGERLLDYSGGGISQEEARPLIELLDQKLGTPRIRFFVGVGYRHVMRWSGGPVEVVCTPPHEMQGERLADHYPEGEGESTLRRLIEDSYEILDAHPINRRRHQEGKPPANMVWLWGQGRAPKLQPFTLRWGKTGAMVAEVDVVKGLGVLAGLEVPTIPGATGYVDTDYRAIGQYAVQMIQKHDFVYVHIEAPDEAGHHGDAEAKTWAIEQIDQQTLAPIVSHLNAQGTPFRLMVVPDHFTPVAKRTHAEGAVPFLLYNSQNRRTNRLPYDESILDNPSIPYVEEGWRLIEMLLE